MPVKLNSSGGGSVTLDVPSTASTFTATVPANTGTLVTTGSTAAVTQGMLAAGVAGNGPAFSATSNAAQTVSNNTLTKITTLVTEVFDTASCFANSRFTPNVAGYYLVGGSGSGTSLTQLSDGIQLHEVRVFKNGSSLPGFGTFWYTPFYGGASSNSFHQSLVYLNGTTDFVELYARVVGAGTLSIENSVTMFGFLARAA